MIKLGITGCTGKLGISIIQQLDQYKNIELVSAVSRKGNQQVGEKIAEPEVVIVDEFSHLRKSDVIIDCTNAVAFRENIGTYTKLKKPLVIATTGFTDADMEQIAGLAKIMPVIISGNFSISLFNFMRAISEYAANLSDDTDITMSFITRAKKMHRVERLN